MIALGCSESDSSSGGCGSSGTAGCDIDSTATTCGDRITIACTGDETPEAESQCEKAIEQDDEAIYCCTSAVEAADAESAGEAGAGGAGA
jgi:hypothetical protein